MHLNIHIALNHLVSVLLLARTWIFFPKKELFKFFRELFAKERSYPSTTKLHDEARKQVRTCILHAQNIYKTKYSSIINYVIIWSTCNCLIPLMPFEEKTIFVTEKDVICIKKKTLFVPEKDVTIFGNDVAITL